MANMLFPQTDSNDDGDSTEITQESTENGASAPSESSTENQSGTAGQDEGQKPTGEGGEGKDKNGAGFADDPRWQEREENWKTRFNDQEKRHQDDMKKIYERLDQSNSNKLAAPQGQQGTQEVEVPDWFNGDQEAYQSYLNHQNTLFERNFEARQSKEREQRESQDKLVQEATQYFNDQITEIEGDKTLNPDGDKLDQNTKNRLMKIAQENDLIDSKMRWNWKAAYRLLKSMSPASSTQSDTDTKKKIAAASTEKGGAESKPSKVTGSDFFRKTANRPW